jgi:dissimilatory sulfite reductase (desulfoviridin) alpha/beta subunit
MDLRLISEEKNMKRVNYKELKKGGFMRQVQPDYFSMRLKIVGGQVESGPLRAIYEISQKYGRGYIHLTSRQGIEIPFIKLEDIETVKQELARNGLEVGACGPQVRTITACQGNVICPSGLIDTTALARELDQRYFGRVLPHKFKLGITGCRNNCLKAEENDLGIRGGLKPYWNETKCNFCGLCAAVCRNQAISVDKDNHTLIYEESQCILCGRCAKSCPTTAWEGESGYILYFGGLYGNKIAVGSQLLPIIFSTAKLFKVIDATLTFFEKHGQPGERLGRTLERTGWEPLQKELAEVVK